MSHAISAINYIEVPEGMEATAIEVRAQYVAYFQRQAGFVSSTFFRGCAPRAGHTQFVNIVVWESKASLDAVVNAGFDNPDGENRDGMKVLGKGFPPPIVVRPGLYTLIAQQPS